MDRYWNFIKIRFSLNIKVSALYGLGMTYKSPEIFDFLRSNEARISIFGHMVASTITDMYVKLYRYQWVSLQMMVHLIPY